MEKCAGGERKSIREIATPARYPHRLPDRDRRPVPSKVQTLRPGAGGAAAKRKPRLLFRFSGAFLLRFAKRRRKRRRLARFGTRGVRHRSNHRSARAGLVFRIATRPAQGYAASMIAIQVKVPERLDTRLRAVAKQRRTTKVALIRECIEREVGSPTAEPNGKSCFDLAKDLAGSVRGPRDLSTNQKYFSGFGR